jgi:hypothetical protein
MTISLEDYFQGRDTDKVWASQCTLNIRANAEMLIDVVNQLLAIYGQDLPVTSGWRPAAYNLQVGGSPTSKHVTGNAVDIADGDGAFKDWLKDNVDQLIKLDLYMEAPACTPTWVHLQRLPPRSKARIFVPY